MTKRFTPKEMAYELLRMAEAKVTWLDTFAAEGWKKRPDGEIAQKRLELAVLRKAKDDYHAADQRKQEESAS